MTRFRPKSWSIGTRTVIVALVTTAAAAAATQPTAPPSFPGPYLPTADDAVLQQVPPESNPRVQAIRRLRVLLDRTPENIDLANRLASAYIDFGRELGDAHSVGYAEAVLSRWMRLPSPPVSTLVLQATILQYRHQFDAARVQLRRALSQDPTNVQAWLTTATLDMVQGQYDDAAIGCSRVAERGGPILGAICSANLQSYLGQASRSVAVLQAIGLQVRGTSPAYSAWVEGLIAESAERLGDWVVVEDHYRKALALTPDDNFLLVSYADFLLDRGRPSEVLKLLAPYTQSDTAFLRIVLAEAALQDANLAKDKFLMAARFEALALRGDDLFGREQVRFALHAQADPTTALELAEQNWKVQRAPWDIRVFLEAAVAANRPDAAAPILAFVDRTKLEDPIIHSLAAKLRATPPGPVNR